MTAALSPSDRALLVYEAEGRLAETCQAYAEQREYRGDHVFKDELLRRCLAWGRALNLECLRDLGHDAPHNPRAT